MDRLWSIDAISMHPLQTGKAIQTVFGRVEINTAPAARVCKAVHSTASAVRTKINY